MADKSVFRSLREVFPQVDLRVLKAVAIEHSKDVDAAVEFILSEVLPYIGGSSEESYTHPDTQVEHPSAKVGLNKQIISVGDQGVEEVNASLLSVPKSVASVTTLFDDHTSLAHVKSPCMGEPVVEGSHVGCVSNTKEPCSLIPYNEVGEELNASLPSEAKCMESKMDLISDHKNDTFPFKSYSAKTKVDGSPSGVDSGNNQDQLIVEPKNVCYLEQVELRSCLGLAENGNDALLAQVFYGLEAEEVNGSPSGGVDIGNSHDQLIVEPEDVCYLKQVEHPFRSCLGLAENGSDALLAQEFYGLEAEEIVSAMHANSQNSSPVVKRPDLMDYGAVVEKDISSVSECEHKLLQCSNLSTIGQYLCDSLDDGTASVSFSSDQNILSAALENLMDFTNIGAESQKDLNNSTTEHEKKLSTCLAENVSDLSAFENALVSLDSHLPSTITTRSGHNVSIDFLEDFIADAKSNKKTLASDVEMVSNMLKEVEFLEETAKQAKEEASTAGQDILIKAEELKQMSKHAMEANDMHAGEVYGEKAILAAEARELQSRLLNLSSEKNKSLSIIEEVRRTLEARIAAVEKDIIAAEQEKFEKEELARKALHEQEVVMDALAEESKKLQQAAEENSKLREFLMDRGRMVDMLQGEIAVICEDVLSLKDRVEGRVPLNRSRSSTASSLASSTSSSFHKSTTSSDRVLQPAESAESPQMMDQVHPKTQQGEGIGAGKEVYAGDKQKASSDDEWEIFDA